jgi:hypothetical protein
MPKKSQINKYSDSTPDLHSGRGGKLLPDYGSSNLRLVLAYRGKRLAVGLKLHKLVKFVTIS